MQVGTHLETHNQPGHNTYKRFSEFAQCELLIEVGTVGGKNLRTERFNNSNSLYHVTNLVTYRQY